MKYRELGNTGIEASAVVFGAWAIGGWMWGGTEQNDPVAAIHAGLASGINMIDTAAIYGFGLSEEIVGKALEGRRDKAVLATKCGLRWDLDKGEHFFDSDGKSIHKYLGPESVRRELEDSLRRLRTDYIDLYQTHWQESTTAVEDTMAALLDLRDQGKIRAIGVSNVEVPHIRDYLESGEIASVQNNFSMLDRAIEKDVAPFCREKGISILAYSPLALGLLTGKMTPGREFEEGDQRRSKPRFTIENRARINGMLDEMRPVAEKRGANLAQLVIAWTINRPGITHALVGARRPSQAEENAAAGDIELDGQDMDAIEKILEKHGPFPPK